jgi:hypothetical protein
LKKKLTQTGKESFLKLEKAASIKNGKCRKDWESRLAEDGKKAF